MRKRFVKLLLFKVDTQYRLLYGFSSETEQSSYLWKAFPADKKGQKLIVKAILSPSEADNFLISLTGTEPIMLCERTTLKSPQLYKREQLLYSDGDTVVFVCHNSSDIALGLRADNGDRCPDRHIAHGKYTEGTGGNGQLTVALNGKCTLAHNTGADIGTQGGPNCGAVVHGVLRTLLRGDARIGRQEDRASALYIRLR